MGDKVKKLIIAPGSLVAYLGGEYQITKIIDINSFIAQNIHSGNLERLEVAQVMPLDQDKQESSGDQPIIELINDKDWMIAQQRFAQIRPLLENSKRDGSLVKEIAASAGVYVSTIYRWIEKYEETGTISSLAPSQKGPKGKILLDENVEFIVKQTIQDTYLTKQKKSIQRTCNEIIRRCKNANLNPPHPNTIRNRISALTAYERVHYRLGKKVAQHLYDPKVGSFPDADHPLSVIQIDHTKLDIVVVDDQFRRPIGRPWITLAIDVCSRMVAGFYVSLDPPGAMGTGLCLCHAILPKEKNLALLDVHGEWPYWGIMKRIHLDNAKEFRGNMLKKACEEYGIDISWRPVATPNWGGHIERLLGTLLKEIHTLPGTTFSNPQKKGDYDSDKNAALTLKELERWLTTYIVNVYHNRVHSALGMSPLEKLNEGIFGNNEKPGIGIPPRILEDRKLRLDFMPYEERTVQEYGIIIDHIYYYHDVLRRWVNSVDPSSGKGKAKRKFIFKRDPRDISKVFFLDPELKDYFPIPYRNISYPPMSIWEYKEVLASLKEQYQEKAEINEARIFKAYNRLVEIEEKAVTDTRKTKKIAPAILKRQQKNNNSDNNTKDVSHDQSLKEETRNFDNKNITPFDDIEL